MYEFSMSLNDFNSHAHVERDLRLHCYIPQRQNFNSHAHVERDRKTTEHDTDSRISTHTLTWSVTCSVCIDNGDINISTHTLTWSVTARSSPRRRPVHISTHTLTWSVTFCPCWRWGGTAFQLTRSRGA